MMLGQVLYFLRGLLFLVMCFSLTVQAGKRGREENAEEITETRQLESPLKKSAIRRDPSVPIIRISPPKKSQAAQKRVTFSADVESVASASSRPEHAEEPTYTHARTLEEFRAQLDRVAREQVPFGLRENCWEVPDYPFGVEELYWDFCRLELPDASWERAAEALQVIRWPNQSLKDAVGAHLFLQVAADESHQNLLRNALRPLLDFATKRKLRSKEKLLQDVYAKASKSLWSVLPYHPYLLRRMALVGFAAAARLGNPLARLFLVNSVGGHVEESWGDFVEGFFAKNERRILRDLKDAEKEIAAYINVPGIENFVDLSGEALNDPAAVQAKAALGLPRYERRLGELLIEDEDRAWKLDKVTLQQALDHYLKAGERGDWNGYDNANQLILSLLWGGWRKEEEKLYPQEKHEEAYQNARLYKNRALWLGFCEEGQKPDKHSIETERGIFESTKRFLSQKRMPPT